MSPETCHAPDVENNTRHIAIAAQHNKLNYASSEGIQEALNDVSVSLFCMDGQEHKKEMPPPGLVL